MWKCPDCGREFARRNQSHYCGSAPETVEAYIARQEERLQPFLRKLCGVIRENLPDAQEKISWSMPTWRNAKENLLHVAVNGGRIDLYVGKQIAERLSGRTGNYAVQGGAVRIDPTLALNREVVARIARLCAEA